MQIPWIDSILIHNWLGVTVYFSHAFIWHETWKHFFLCSFCKKRKKKNSLIQGNDSDLFKPEIPLPSYTGYAGCFWFTKQTAQKNQLFVNWTILVSLFFACIPKRHISVCIPVLTHLESQLDLKKMLLFFLKLLTNLKCIFCPSLSFSNLSLVALHTYKYRQADRQVPGTRAVSHTHTHTQTDCKQSLRGHEALYKHSELLLSSLLRRLLNNSRPERPSADVCVCVFLADGVSKIQLSRPQH